MLLLSQDGRNSLVFHFLFPGKKTLIDLENELLRLLNETRGSLLDDAELFDTLQVSKATSETVKRSLEIAEMNEVQIDAAREVKNSYDSFENSLKYTFLGLQS